MEVASGKKGRNSDELMGYGPSRWVPEHRPLEEWGGGSHLCPSCSAATQVHLHLNREALCRKRARPLELDWFSLCSYAAQGGKGRLGESCFLLVCILLFSLVIFRGSEKTALCNGSGFGHEHCRPPAASVRTGREAPRLELLPFSPRTNFLC